LDGTVPDVVVVGDRATAVAQTHDPEKVRQAEERLVRSAEERRQAEAEASRQKDERERQRNEKYGFASPPTCPVCQRGKPVADIPDPASAVGYHLVKVCRACYFEYERSQKNI